MLGVRHFSDGPKNKSKFFHHETGLGSRTRFSIIKSLQKPDGERISGGKVTHGNSVNGPVHRSSNRQSIGSLRMSETVQLVKKYYGQELQSSDDLKTDACCTAEAMPDYAKKVMGKIHPEVISKYYGCGLVLPEQVQGCRVLDLGSGAGRDVYTLSGLVGESGSVVGVDMTEEQMAVAKNHIDFHRDAFGYKECNVEFHLGNIEKLLDLPLQPESFDIIVSNCVINLSEDKRAVLEGAYKLLKPGGEIYFSDVYSDRRVPEALRKDPVLYGECLSGALYVNDFLTLAKETGFRDPRMVTSRVLGIDSAEVEAKVAPIKFWSTTYRLFKLPEMDSSCEDYGQAICYKGTLETSPNVFELDSGTEFEKGRITPVCGNTYRMIGETRFAKHFDLYGSFDNHLGPFYCLSGDLDGEEVVESSSESSGGSCC